MAYELYTNFKSKPVIPVYENHLSPQVCCEAGL